MEILGGGTEDASLQVSCGIVEFVLAFAVVDSVMGEVGLGASGSLNVISGGVNDISDTGGGRWVEIGGYRQFLGGRLGRKNTVQCVFGAHGV